ncbi:MAG: dihydropteroate synthase [candidate division WOR-3 bacterium]
MRILAVGNRQDLNRELAHIDVDKAAWQIFAEKGKSLAIRLDGLSTATANILKQTALASGGDCAVNRRVVSGRVRKSDAILFVTQRQLKEVCRRLQRQPECVARLVPELEQIVERHLKPSLTVRVWGKLMDLGKRTHVMGILNVTPDSFYDGGRYLEPDRAVEQGVALASDGADFIDIGAESTRPGSSPVGPKEQLARLLPVLKRLVPRVKVPISIDTSSAEVARVALAEGAAMVNDVTGFRGDPKMAKLVARTGVPCIVMHMKGSPKTMQRNPRYQNLMAEIYSFLAATLNRGERAGISRGQMIVDPGIGFGKLLQHNLEILRRLRELKGLGVPVLVGPSRKSFIGQVLDLPAEERLEGTLAACVVAARNGANILRVHDVKATLRALRLADAIGGE